MDQEQFVRRIISKIMKPLDNGFVSFIEGTPASAASAQTPAAGTRRIGRDECPLAERHPELVKTNIGKALDGLAFKDVRAGKLSPLDFRIPSETLELRAQVVSTDGRQTLACSLYRAAELMAVPDVRLLEIYNALRPYRSTKAELYETADELEDQYDVKVNAGFIHEVTGVYKARGRLRKS